MSTTPERDYPEIPYSPNPDVPYYVNLSLRAVDSDVQGVAASVTATGTAAAAYTDTKVAAVAADVTELEETKVSKDDGRLLELTDVPGVSFGVVTEADQRTWLEVSDTTAGPTAYAAQLMGDALGFRDTDLSSGELVALVDSQDRIHWAVYPDAISEDWAHFGDSLTDNAITGAQAWVTQLAALTGRNHFNGGWYGQRHDQIAARQGALPAIITVAGNVTAGAGATTITEIKNSPVLPSATRNVTGVLAGVPGTITQPVDTVYFTPDVPGVYAIPAKSRFIPDSAGYRDRIATFWSGRNSIYDTSPAVIVASIQAMVDHLKPGNLVSKRYLVLEIPPATSDNSATDADIAAINAALAAAFPGAYVPMATWLRTDEAAAAAGIAWTAGDLDDIAAGNTPGSFRSDNIHFNGTACKAIAYKVHQEAQKRGWL